MLWQRIANPATVLHLLTHDLAPEMREPGTYMYESLDYRDQWESRLLRTAFGRRCTETSRYAHGDGANGVSGGARRGASGRGAGTLRRSERVKE